jgi:chromosome segregation ATPase
VLYLAEVQKKTTFIGGTKAELKLLACQRADQSWSAVPGDEVIAAEEANNMNGGVLVLVELSGNRQMQRPPQEAGRQLVNILQNFTRLLEKSKNQEEEIEQWKQSLTYQSQELNRREMEMEARLEQLQQMEEELERLEQKRQEINKADEKTQRLRQEVDRKRQELEKAWEHLRGEQQRFGEQQSEQAAVLDNEEVDLIQDLLDRLSAAIAPTDSLREQLNLAFGDLNNQQAALDYHWQQMEQQQALASQMQAEVESQNQDLHYQKQEWQQGLSLLEQARTQLTVQQKAIEMKQESADLLTLQMQKREDLTQQIYRLATGDADNNGPKVDIVALEKMPLEKLQETVQLLQKELERSVRFVNDQEEELADKRQTIEELQSKISQASEYDRISLEADLADEQDGYQMLNKTLQGQRENLREREEFFKQHRSVLRRRQGIAESEEPNKDKIDLEPILKQMEEQRQQQSELLQNLQSQIEEMRSHILQAQSELDRQASIHQAKHDELQSMEQQILSQQTAAAELWGKVNLYQETLQPQQEALNGMRQNLEAQAEFLNQIQKTGEYQLWAITEMQQTFNSLLGRGQHLAAS